MAAPTYSHDIPSLSQTIPALPPLRDLDVNRAIVSGSPIDAANLTNAKITAIRLKAALDSSMVPEVTNDMVEKAELRHRAVEGARIAAAYAPGLMEGIAAVLQRLTAMDQHFTAMDQRFDGIDERLSAIETNIAINSAELNNQRIITRNKAYSPIFHPLQKTIPGDGYNKARAISRPADGPNLVQPPQPAAIGAIPPDFDCNISSYSNIDIANLVIFYNDDFGIVITDNKSTRINKVIAFLCQSFQ
ncbi:hypothetical protein BDN70DRAFT_884204 [Pholiota conissans]|uniref:Uncharacterized protein n=1 Tax=Pholiota conissans TaxID=109636 RepID=A0A9P5YSG9_9AGAR|nr:hypothetical protein BDN70DRAFT_884204 [Pholiota conissans]